MSRIVAGVMLMSVVLGCGASEEKKPSERARLDIHGTVGSSRVDLTNADVPFYKSSVDDSMISFETLDGDRIIALNLAGRVPVGTHLIGHDYGDEWDSSIAGANVGYYEGSKEWHAWSSKHTDHFSPITFVVKTSTSSELSGRVAATLLAGEDTSGNAEADLEVRIHGFGEGQNAFGGSGSGGSTPSGSTCAATKSQQDDFGKATVCTQAPCSETKGSVQNFKTGTCSTSKVKYGCCGIPKGLTVYAYEPCTMGNCESLSDWNRTCSQLGGTGRAGVCP